MNKKLYVGGLSFSVTDEQLRELFTAHGTVESATVIKDKFTDQSRGFGFVEMGTQQEAENAIAALNGTQHQGRTITVNMSKPREDRGGGGRGGRSGGGGNRW
jgi:RNA recognition motif-containing protein